MRRSVAVAWTIGALLLFLAVVGSQWIGADRAEIDFTFFDKQVRAHNVKSIDVHGPIAYGEFYKNPMLQGEDAKAKAATKDEKPATEESTAGRKFWVSLPSENVDPDFVRQWRDAGVQSIQFHKPKNYSDLLLLVWLGLLVFLVIGGWGMARRARDQMLGGGMLPGVLRSPARRYSTEGPRVTFNDVAGLGNVTWNDPN